MTTERVTIGKAYIKGISAANDANYANGRINVNKVRKIRVFLPSN